jgi:hypothetical protein
VASGPEAPGASLLTEVAADAAAVALLVVPFVDPLPALVEEALASLRAVPCDCRVREGVHSIMFTALSHCLRKQQVHRCTHPCCRILSPSHIFGTYYPCLL